MSTPANSLNIKTSGLVTFDGTATFSADTTTTHNVLLGAASNGITNLAPGATSTVLRSTGASSDPGWTTNFQVSSGDVMTNSGQPAFFAYLSSTASSVTGDGTGYKIACDTVVFDNASNYSNSTYTFTAPVTGTYLFYGSIQLSGIIAANNSALLQIVTTSYNAGLINANPFVMSVSGVVMFSSSIICKMTANDTATLDVSVSDGLKDVNVVGAALASSPSAFGGYLIC